MFDILAKVLNPVGSLLELGTHVLGLPPEIGNAAKIAAGAMTGNVVGIIDGGISLTTNLVKRATTEYQPSKSSASGYASAPEDARLQQFKTHLETVRDNFAFVEDSWLPFFKNGAWGGHEMEMAIARPDCPPKLREALLFLKNNPDLYGFLETANGVGWKDGAVAVNDVHSAIFKLSEQLERTPKRLCDSGTERQASSGSSGRGGGDRWDDSVSSRPAQGGSGSRGGLDPNFDEYLSSLRTLEANFRTYDSAVGQMDGGVGRLNLRAIVDNPNASETLKKAARFLLNHEEYFRRVDHSGETDRKEGFIGREDVQRALTHAKEDTSRYGVDRSSGSSSAGTVQSILNDPSLTQEEKLQMILFSVMDRIDDETLSVMEEIDSAQSKNGGDDAKTDQKKRQSLEKLQLKLQQLTERRKQMFELLTNLSTKFNEMAKAAISNMARA
jgi:hypothetical protein